MLRSGWTSRACVAALVCALAAVTGCGADDVTPIDAPAPAPAAPGSAGAVSRVEAGSPILREDATSHRRPAAGTAVVVGRLLAERGRLPPGVVVHCVPLEPRGVREPVTATVDADGGFRATVGAPGDWRVFAVADGWPAASAVCAARVTAGARLDVGALRLGPGRTVAGVVRAQGAAAEGIGITDADGSVLATTGADGRFACAGLPYGPLALRIVAPRWRSADVSVASDATADVARIEVDLEPTAWLDVRVVDADSGAAIETFALRIDRLATLDPPADLAPPGRTPLGAPADEHPDGRVALRGLDSGLHAIEVAAAGYAPGRALVRIGARGDPEPLVVRLSPAVAVGGRVVRRDDGRPVAAARVVIATRAGEILRSTRADATGAFRLIDLPPRTVLVARATDDRGAAGFRVVPAGGDFVVEVGPAATLAGRVAGVSSDTVATVAAHCAGDVRLASVDGATGDYRFDELPAGTWSVLALSVGPTRVRELLDEGGSVGGRPRYEAAVAELAAGVARRQDLDLQRVPRATLVALVTRRGEAAVGAIAELSFGGELTVAVRRVDADGRVLIDDLPAGDYLLLCRADLGGPALAHRTVPIGSSPEPVTVELALPD
ncbi:MAG: carboxypeptidase regulatory-like domain-containing protein [Planctomycetes bacterium]|nr:carboxypeptidase regulatory-like domain-containing protein [Planctomycetota bacterium]